MPAGGADEIDEDRDDDGAKEREPDRRADRSETEHSDGNRHEEGRPGIDAEDAGICQRVPRCRLDQRSRHTEGCPAEKTEQGTG